MMLRGKTASRFGLSVASGIGITVFSLAGVEAQAQTSSIALDPIEVQSSRRGASRIAPGDQAPAPAQQDQQSPYGPGEGYTASRSATGTKTDTPISEIPQSISVVTQEEIRDQGAQTVQEALRYVPGTFADAYGPDSRGDYPRVRGSDPNIYLDGMRAINTYKFMEWRPDPFTLSRIEVLRGPASVLYGDMTTAGLVNMVSKLPQAFSHNEIGVQYGSFDRKQVQLDSTGKLTADGQWLYRMIGVFRDSGYQTDYVPNDRVLIQPAVTWKPTNDTTWTLLGFYQKDKTGSSTAFLPHVGTVYPGAFGFIPVNRFVGEPGFDRYQVTTGSASSIFEHTFSENFKIRQSTRYMHTNGMYHTMYPDLATYDAATGKTGRSIWMDNVVRNSVTSDTNAQFRFSTGPVEHKLLAGFDYRFLTDHGENGFASDSRPFDLYKPVYTGVTPPDLSSYEATRQIQAGMYLQDQMRFGQWIAVAGVRYDKLTSKAEFSPSQQDHATTSRLGLMYELPGGLNPYVTWGTSFNPIFGANMCVSGSFCKPKEGELKEVGFKYNPRPGLAVNGALFDITEKNREVYDELFLIRQIGEARIRGGELEVVGTVAPGLDIVGAYSYTDGRVTQGDFVGSRLEVVPLHQASLWAKQKFSMFGIDGFSIGAGARYVGKSWSTGPDPFDNVQTIETPSFMLYDAMFAWEDAHWRFQINATNLGDKAHVTTCLARGDCFYGSRRTILSSLTYKF